MLEKDGDNMTKYVQSSDDTMARGKMLYQALMELSSNPMEATKLIIFIHATLWLNHRSGDRSIDEMLKLYCDAVRMNCEIAESTTQ